MGIGVGPGWRFRVFVLADPASSSRLVVDVAQRW